MDSLADLRDLIIGRLQQTISLANDQSVLVGGVSACSMEEELQINRSVIRLLGALKRQEKERVESESVLMERMRSVRFLSNKTIDDVYTTCTQIFAHFDPAFSPHGGEDTLSSDRLRHLLVSFFEKHYSRMASGQSLKMLSRPITETTPAFLMSWVSEWSRCLFLNRIQTAAGAQFARHQQEMKRLTANRGSNLIREKSASPVSHSAFLGRGDMPIVPVLTNKESVFGLIIQEMIQHYKSLPLQLDMSYPKSMKKIQGKSDFWNEQNLQKAAEILIQAKNRQTRDQIGEFATQCELYFQRSSRNTLKKQLRPLASQQRSSVQLRSKSPQKKFSPFQKFFQRVKSESKEEGVATVGADKRNSLLLCPKANQISFESSREIMRKLQRDKVKRECQLPQIAPGRVLRMCAAQKSKNSFFQPNYSIVSNYERYDQILNNVIPTKSYDFKQPPMDRPYHRKSREKKAESHQNPQLLRQQGEQLRRNRKMMLQLLREKNKHAFLDK